MNVTIYTHCSECGRAIGPDRNIHGPLCSKQTVEQKAAQAEYYYKAWLESQKSSEDRRDRMAYEVTYWQGKFKIVVEENNALRRKLFKSNTNAH